MKDNKNKRFGEYLYRLRMNQGTSLQEVGKHVGISANYISELERGFPKKVSDEVVRSFANYYGIHEDKLFTILGRVPLAVKEDAESSPELQRLLAEISRNKDLSDEKKEKLYAKVRSYFENLLDDM